MDRWPFISRQTYRRLDRSLSRVASSTSGGRGAMGGGGGVADPRHCRHCIGRPFFALLFRPNVKKEFLRAADLFRPAGRSWHCRNRFGVSAIFLTWVVPLTFVFLVKREAAGDDGNRRLPHLPAVGDVPVPAQSVFAAGNNERHWTRDDCHHWRLSRSNQFTTDGNDDGLDVSRHVPAVPPAAASGRRFRRRRRPDDGRQAQPIPAAAEEERAEE